VSALCEINVFIMNTKVYFFRFRPNMLRLVWNNSSKREYSHKNNSFLDKNFKNGQIAEHLVRNHQKQHASSKNKRILHAFVLVHIAVPAQNTPRHTVFMIILLRSGHTLPPPIECVRSRNGIISSSHLANGQTDGRTDRQTDR